MRRLADRPYWELTYDESGRMTAPGRAEFLGEVAGAGVTDLFVMAHGWGNSQAHARSLYESMFPLIAKAAQDTPALGSIAFVGVFWPSIWFPDTPAAAQRPAGAALATEPAAGEPPGGSGDAALTGREIAETLRTSFEDQARQDTVVQLGQLIDDGMTAAMAESEPLESQQKRVADFHQLLQRLLPTQAEPTFEDSGETAVLYTDEPEDDYARISEIFGSTPPGSATQGLADRFRKVWSGAKDTLRVGSYYTMKSRAGQVGRAGLGPLLEALHTESSGTRVHLVGHSFGARLVSFALAGITSSKASPVASLLLIQGAFSHWSFSHSSDNPFSEPGALNQYADRVHGPLAATFSEHDWAVGRWYPRASFLARQDTSASAAASRWGGMGSDGFQAVSPAADRNLQPSGKDYTFGANTFYRVNGSGVINDTAQSEFSGAHSDIRRPEVAWLAVAAAAAGSHPPAT
jgi:hypothetical protein